MGVPSRVISLTDASGWPRDLIEFLEEKSDLFLRWTDVDLTEIQDLYRQAFRDFGTLALWSMRPAGVPSPADALAITAALRTHADTMRAHGQKFQQGLQGLSF